MRSVNTAEGIVRRAMREADGLWRLTVEVDGRSREALLFEQLTPPADVGDRVALNTTAVDLGLGTGAWTSSCTSSAAAGGATGPDIS
jgi:hypothetical protein